MIGTKDIEILLLAGSEVKHVQCWDMTQIISNKIETHLTEFSEPKIDCITGYLKPFIRENNPDNLIFHVEKNYIPSKKPEHVFQSQLCLWQKK